MSEKIVQLNEEVIKGQLKELVRGSVEETLNELLEAEAEKLTQAARYERNEQRQGYRSGHYNRNLTSTSGDVTLNATERTRPSGADVTTCPSNDSKAPQVLQQIAHNSSIKLIDHPEDVRHNTYSSIQFTTHPVKTLTGICNSVFVSMR